MTDQELYNIVKQSVQPFQATTGALYCIAGSFWVNPADDMIYCCSVSGVYQAIEEGPNWKKVLISEAN